MSSCKATQCREIVENTVFKLAAKLIYFDKVVFRKSYKDQPSEDSTPDKCDPGLRWEVEALNFNEKTEKLEFVKERYRLIEKVESHPQDYLESALKGSGLGNLLVMKGYVIASFAHNSWNLIYRRKLM